MGRPRVRAREGTRERLLAVARERFAAQGFAATSVRELTHAAGCNVAMVSHYFGSKEGLMRELCHEGVLSVQVELRAQLASDAPAGERIARFVRFMVDHLSRNQPMTSIIARELSQGGNDALLDEFLPRISENVQLLTQLLDDARKEGRLAAGLEPRLAAAMLMSMIGHYYHFKPAAERLLGPDTPELRAALVRHIVRIFVAGAIVP